MIYEFVEGTSWSEDEFPCGKNNSYTLGQYIGYNHQVAHKNCGIIGIEDVEDFYSRVYFWIITVVVFGIGALVFKRLKVHFADVL